ncbi:MAG: 2-hydroxyacyl-CoA dehydratase [Eubacteriales bacterium]|nr:2-hydroxyacyl-CoA dehydratase [Eubacteriales bacterium]
MRRKPSQKTLLIPAMLDAHFPLLKYAFYSGKYYPVVMDASKDIVHYGLKYVHNDLCYPGILIVGQILETLNSGKYDVNQTVILEPQAGDACRGSNYIPMIRKALDQAGFAQVPIISLNVTGVERKHRLPITYAMLKKAVAGAFYGDMLMILKNQVLPYEKCTGQTEELYQQWMTKLSKDIEKGMHLSFREMKRKYCDIAQSFAKIPRVDRTIPKIGIIGELYIKYCHLGNWDLEAYLQSQDCEYSINGMTWYALYYVDTHLLSEGGVVREDIMGRFCKLVYHKFLDLQQTMVAAIKEEGLYCMDAYDVFKQKADGYVTYQCSIGDGWLIGAEFVNHVQNGYNRIICGQPFGCLPSHVCGRGLYPALRRSFPDAQYISVDYDASGTDALVKSRIRMLLAFSEGEK